ncbi:MAG: hypothetical protein ACREPM_06710 [Gemmatimonadaceae bacterium]
MGTNLYMMMVGRRSSYFLTASMLGVALIVSAASAPRGSGNVARSLAAATAYFDSIVVLARNAQPVGAKGDRLTVELGYLERERLGLGSPFRLADEAVHDPRLDSASRSRTALALVGRLRRGDAYVMNAAALDGAGPWSADGHGATGAAHLALIDRAVRGASDPRAGELTVRLAYTLAAASGAIAPWSVNTASQVAALLRDRELARRDVGDLVADASDRHEDVLTLLGSRRAARAFRVEQPALARLDSRLQVEAMGAVPALVRAIDTLERVEPREAAPAATATLLGVSFAERLEELGRSRPPVAQVAVTLRARAGATLEASRAANEEMFAAAPVLRGDSISRDDAQTIVAVAVAVRSLAQSAPWFPGDAGPGTSDVAREFGLSNVTFARTVPNAWRPYYTRELRDALRDMETVLPGLSLDGLNVRFGGESLNDSALAMHDPRTRTLELSIETSSGTLAHELAHDLDWQEARRLYANGSGYSTDRAMRERTGALASSMRGLAEARVLRPVPAGASGPPLGRPTEIFARGADWFVASALAQRGESNAFLSVIQDGLLTGYAAGAPAGLGLSGAQSLLSALGEMTYVPDSIASRFESQWADPRSIDPLLLVRRVLETPAMFRGAMLRKPEPWLADASRILATTRASVCVADPSEATLARRNLVLAAIDARAEGAAARRARYRPITAAPEELDRLRDAVRSSLVAELTTATADQGVVPLVPASFRSNTAICSSIAR